jgi:hypothetical protein
LTSVVVCGIAGYLPLAGVALHYLQFCLGLRDLGVEVSYLEDSQAWPQNPAHGLMPDGEASYTIPWLDELFSAFDLPWAYCDPAGRWHGASESEATDRCRRADLLLNVSGGATLSERHRLARATAYVDTDPAFTQVAAEQQPGVREWIGAHDLQFTFAESIGSEDCRLPSAGFHWRTTRQPVWLPFWEETSEFPGAVYTTVMNWRAYGVAVWEGEEWGQKDVSFAVVRDLPRLTKLPLEIAISTGPDDELRADGWQVTDPLEATSTVWRFRDYIDASRAELTVAKQGYVRSRSGWFSERSANYLAAGRPVIAQDTGWSDFLPAGKGLLAYSTTEEAVDALRAVEADPHGHAIAARALAAEQFDAAKVTADLLDKAGVD